MGFGFITLESGSIEMGWMLHRIAAEGWGGSAKELSAFDSLSYFSFYLSFPPFLWLTGRWAGGSGGCFSTTYCCYLLLGR